MKIKANVERVEMNATNLPPSKKTVEDVRRFAADHPEILERAVMGDMDALETFLNNAQEIPTPLIFLTPRQ